MKDIGFYILLGILFSILIFALFQYADAMKIKQLWDWNKPPNVCVWDSDYNEIFKNGLNKWNKVLFDEYGEAHIFAGLVVYPDTKWEQIKLCNVIIVMNEVEYAEYSGVYGRTIPLMKYNKMYIQIFEARDAVNFKESVEQTLMHEFGHALGLGHWIPEDVKEALKPWPETLMWKWQYYENTTIDYATILALKCMYGSDGFAGRNNTCDTFHYKFPVESTEESTLWLAPWDWDEIT